MQLGNSDDSHTWPEIWGLAPKPLIPAAYAYWQLELESLPLTFASDSTCSSAARVTSFHHSLQQNSEAETVNESTAK